MRMFKIFNGATSPVMYILIYQGNSIRKESSLIAGCVLHQPWSWQPSTSTEETEEPDTHPFRTENGRRKAKKEQSNKIDNGPYIELSR